MRAMSTETIVTCSTCGLRQRVVPLRQGAISVCCNCGSVVDRGRDNAVARTAALTLAALILYVPANVYPVLTMSYYGAYSESTVWDGCVQLFHNGQWPVAVVVFLASILIPLLKLLGLLYICITTSVHSTSAQLQRTWVHRVIAAIGPWALLDVFIVAVLVSLVKLGELATVLPGPGLLAFAAVVVLTNFASASFEPRFIWEQRGGPT
jgi:paraquat-inducible protein A